MKKLNVTVRLWHLFVALALALSGLMTLTAAQPVYALNPPPLQVFYLTLPEDVMLQYFRDNFAGGSPVSPVRSVTSIAIGTNDTIVYYDQWEDGGYDADMANPEGNYYDAVTNPDGTQIWGDGVIANGCPPSINNSPNPCTRPEHDRLYKGNVITLDNQVSVQGSPGSYSRNPSQIFFDGRDKVGVTLPVAITRAMWPTGPGSLVADAQSVLPTERWGAQYVSPVGEDIPSTGQSYEDVRWLIMAGLGGANITVDVDGPGPASPLNYTLAEGAARMVDGIRTGATLTGDNAVQVTLLTADVTSSYENRFYNLIPRSDWVSEYYTSVGTGTGTQCTNVWVYNPNATSITVNYQIGSGTPGSFPVGANAAAGSPNITTGNGARFWTTGSPAPAFLPVSMTDCTNSTSGDIYDWGNELYPANQLSPELLIGWTPGCSNESYRGVCLDSTNTGRTTSRTVVWLTPLANTTIYVDTNGSGISCPGGVGAEKTINASALLSYQVNDDPTSRAYVHDNFGTQSYNRLTDSQGFPGATPVNWSTSWTESGDDGQPTGGMIWITGGVLQFRDNGGTNETNISIRRSHNMAGQQYSRFSFRIQWAGSFQSDDAIAVEVSPDGSTWTTLEIINGPISFATGEYANRVYITSAYNSANTTVRFRTIGNLEAGDTWSIDEVHIDYAPDGDFDMTGAYIRTCDDTLLAAAFGQNPALSFSGDEEAMDLGMGIPPYGSQIRLRKVADKSFVAPGGEVTYTYEVKLIQTFSTSVNDVTVVDDFCAPVHYSSGDNNTNNALDPGETWVFRCTTRLSAQTTNTAIAYAFYNTEPIRSLPAQATVRLTSTLGDYVWVDEDGDGDQDAGEPGIPNVKVTLVGTDIDGNPVSRTTYTDARGRYIFTDVPPSNTSGYTITVDQTTLPAGLAANPTYDENGVVGTPHTTVVVLGSGIEYTTADFGYNWASPAQTNTNTGLGMIGNRVWIDANGNGRQDPGEPGLYNVTVELLTAGPDGIFGTADDIIAATTTTDYAGNYAFDELAASAYIVRIPSPPGGYTLTGDPDQPGASCTVCDGRTTMPIVLAPGDVYLNADFGYQPTSGYGATIGDTLWVDADRDNVPDADEPSLPGVTVSLIRDLNGNGIWDAGEPIIATTLTNQNGEYAFTGVPVADGVGTDDYLVWVNDTANVLGELRPVYDSDSVGTPNLSVVSNLTPSGNLDQDFAYAPPGHDADEALVGDTIWLDQNGNGVYAPSEGLEGVVVNLLNNSGQIIARAITNENGQYFFGGLAGGTYTVDININSLPNYGIGLTNFSDPDGGTPHRATLTLASGGINLAQDFGYRNLSGYTIGGTLWHDTDADGLLEGSESGRYAGVTVALYTDSNDNGVWDPADMLVGTTTTDASGNYAFTGLPNDRYFVDVTDDAQVLLGNWKSTGPTPGADNNSQADYYTVVLAGANNFTADFGYYRDPARIGDFVWEDLDRDGIQDPGEPGLAGVTVQLTIVWPGGGGSTILTTVTDASGYYSFGNLLLDEDFDGVGTPEPTFSITFSTPTTYELTTPNAGSDDTKDSDYTGTPLAVTVTEGQYNDTIDCGFRNTYLSIYKTSNANAAVNAGDTIQYTIVIANNTPVLHTGIAVTDPLPGGTTYVAQSTVATGYLAGSFYYLDDFATQSYSGAGPGSAAWGTNWTEVGESDGVGAGSLRVVNTGWTGGSPWYLRIQPTNTNRRIWRQANMSTCSAGGTLSYDYRNALNTTGREVRARIYVGGTQQGADLAVYNSSNQGSGNASFTLTGAQMASNTQVSFDVTAAGTDNIYLYVDNVRFTCNTLSAATKDNIPGGVNPDLQNGAPPSLVVASDGFALNPGQSMQITFRVTVNAPTVLFSIDNTASVVSTQQPAPRSASVSDPVNRLAAIGDRVWLDENSDGVQDAGEPGIANVRVTLTGTDINGNSVNRTTVTDSEGRYLFNVPAGSYTISVDPNSLAPGLAANPTYDENGIATPHTTAVMVGIGQEHVTANFGYNWAATGDVTGNTGTGAIGDRIWADADGDGRQDPGEPGLYGVTVELLTAGPDGRFGTADDVVAATTTTDYAGHYIFDDLAVGAYVVRVTPPTGYTQTGDPDSFGAVCVACDNRTTTPILLAPGDVYVNADFGYQPEAGTSATIGDTLWVDANRNNTPDAGEPRLAGVSVVLIRDLNGNGIQDAGEPIIAATLTNQNGEYAFTGVPVTDGVGTDDYLVWVNDTANVLAELTPAYDSDGSGTPNISAVADLTPAGNLDQDFAYAPPGHDAGEGSIGDTIFLDRNGSNGYNPGEGLEGVRVRLYASDGSTLLAETVTNENGQYFFGNLPAGTYVVRIATTTLPNGGVGLTNTVDPDTPSPGNNQSTVTIGAGGINLNQDFGYVSSALNTIGGTIWNDTNADGTLAGGENGRFAGVTVALYNASGNLVATTTTDSNGNYAFINLPDGTYRVNVTDEAHVLNGYWKSNGADPGADNHSQVDPYTVSVSGGQTNTTADFGYYVAPAALGDYVWLDRNNNGIQASDEPGIRGVKVTLTIAYPNGGTTTLVTYTDRDGMYSFGNLLLDENFNLADATNGTPTYTINFTLPPGMSASPVGQGGDPAQDSNGLSPIASPLYRGQPDITYDSGFWTNRLDLGDLPNVYYTEFRHGPAHILFPESATPNVPATAADGTPAVWLGNIVDVESNGQPGELANLDDNSNLDEDGLGVPSQVIPGSTANFIVTVNASAAGTTVYFGLWIDWGDGTGGLPDGVFDAFYAGNGVTGSPTNVNVPVSVPANYSPGGRVYIRLRAADFPLLEGDSTGTIINGEVEDYRKDWPTAITLADFTAAPQGNAILLTWETAAELDNAGFNLYRSETPAGPYTLLNDTLIPPQFPGEVIGGVYTWLDTEVQPGVTYFYKLEDIDLQGVSTFHGPVTVTARAATSAPTFTVFLPLVFRQE